MKTILFALLMAGVSLADDAPKTVVAHPTRAAVYVLAPENGTIYEIEAASLDIKRRVRPAQSAVSSTHGAGSASPRAPRDESAGGRRAAA